MEIISFILKLIFRSVKECLNGKVGDIGCPRDEEIERTKPCFFDECPHYSEWYSWTLCSKSCGGGIHQRHRICKHGDIGDFGCPPGQDKEHQNCEEDPCPHWGSWTRWSPCDKKCGRGYQIARRGCEFGYKNLSGCRGPDLKRKLCFKHCKEKGFADFFVCKRLISRCKNLRLRSFKNVLKIKSNLFFLISVVWGFSIREYSKKTTKNKNPEWSQVMCIRLFMIADRIYLK